jgi:hypothetical protein
MLGGGTLDERLRANIPRGKFACVRRKKSAYVCVCLSDSSLQTIAMAEEMMHVPFRSYEDLAPDGDYKEACIRCGLWLRDDLLYDRYVRSMLLTIVNNWAYSDQQVIHAIRDLEKWRQPCDTLAMLHELEDANPVIKQRLPGLTRMLNAQQGVRRRARWAPAGNAPDAAPGANVHGREADAGDEDGGVGENPEALEARREVVERRLHLVGTPE